MTYDHLPESIRIFLEEEERRRSWANLTNPMNSLGGRLATASTAFEHATAAASAMAGVHQSASLTGYRNPLIDNVTYRPANGLSSSDEIFLSQKVEAIRRDLAAATSIADGVSAKAAAIQAATLQHQTASITQEISTASSLLDQAQTAAAALQAAPYASPRVHDSGEFGYSAASMARDAHVSALRQEADSLARKIADATIAIDRVRGAPYASILHPGIAAQEFGRTLPNDAEAFQSVRSRLVEEIIKGDAFSAAGGVRNYLQSLQEKYRAEMVGLADAHGYRDSVERWISGNSWHPAVHSALQGIDAPRAAAINLAMEGWRDRPEYIHAFSALAAASDAMAFSKGDYSTHASVFGDIQALKFGADFASSPQARLTAYRDAGFDPVLLKPNQHALTAMLTLNGYVDPGSWQRDGHLIVPLKRPSMRDRLKALKPTRLQLKAYGEACSLERWLRAFIDEQMSYVYGDDWYETHAPKKLIGKIKKWKEDDKEVTGIVVMDDADFAHYLEIILDDTHWEDVFSDIFADRNEAEARLRLFKELRVAIAHFKGFGKADLAKLRECARWFEVKTEDYW